MMTLSEEIRKTLNILETIDTMGIIKLTTQQLKYLKNIDIKEVNVEYQSHPHSKQKACFNNAFLTLSHNKNAYYVLGYVVYHGIPIEHAWIKENNIYYDVTLDPTKQDTYFSVAEFTLDEIYPYVQQYKSAPSLYDMNRFLAMKKKEI